LSADDFLTCVQVHPPHAHDSPFEECEGFTAAWWAEVPFTYENGRIELLLFRSAGVEVARAQIEFDKAPGPMYDVPALAARYVELVFLEVSESHRRRGIGKRAVEAIMDRYPGVGLLAYSEEADVFWDMLGWQRFMHGEEPIRHRPLYVRPLQDNW
jgi:GNAT superfamily N-acetyltransferase